ncbi:MAG: class I SAM-dependent methyltransferase [Nanoarchaeota archaeon]|nr:class I SAM-dependent methyltransferase [Nanoarchaeota archaeon]
MTKEISLERWKLAQKSEKDLWAHSDLKEIIKLEGEYYSTRAKELPKIWSKFISLDKNTRILQIGCGPLDVINYLNFGQKYSIDPLAEFYKKIFKVDYESSHLTEAAGEKIPFPDKYFEVVIITNVLDHTHIPSKTLDEIHRVLKDNGLLHLETHTYQKQFLFIAKIWGFFKKLLVKEIFNIHHPHMFLKQEVKNLVSKKFMIVDEHIGKEIGLVKNLKELRARKLKDKKITVRIPALFGLLGTINYMLICRKK